MFDDPALQFMPNHEGNSLPPGEDTPPGGPTGDPQPDPQADSNTSNASLTARIRELESQLADSQDAMQSADRKHLIESALLKAGAIDIETASLLIERLLEDTKDDNLEDTIEQTVLALRADKPFLFAQDPAPASAVLASLGLEDTSIQNAAQLATNQGDRSSLLRYLRLRRGSLN